MIYTKLGTIHVVTVVAWQQVLITSFLALSLAFLFVITYFLAAEDVTKIKPVLKWKHGIKNKFFFQKKN